MITIVVLEDEQNVCRLVREALKQRGYTVWNEPDTAGLLKIVKKGGKTEKGLSEKNILYLKETLLCQKNGEVYKVIMAEVERPLLELVLDKTEGNQLKAAKMLGINRNTLRTKMKKLGIEGRKWKT